MCESHFIFIILNSIVLKYFVSRSFKIIIKWLEWSLEIVSVGYFFPFVMIQVIVIIENMLEVARVIIQRVSGVSTFEHDFHLMLHHFSDHLDVGFWKDGHVFGVADKSISVQFNGK